MRRIIKLLKFSFLALFLAIVFYQVWYPLTSEKFENFFLSTTINKESNPIALAPIQDTGINFESVGSISINEPEIQLDASSYVTTDPRILAMRQFLIDHHSPLYPYSDVFVKEADKVGLDWRLVVSISGVESAFGNLIPYRSNNAWGWKGDPNRPWSLFTSWPQGIHTVTERMALGYGTELTPFDIEATYCPPCGLNPAHAWANGVNNYMNELDNYLEEI